MIMFSLSDSSGNFSASFYYEIKDFLLIFSTRKYQDKNFIIEKILVCYFKDICCLYTQQYM